MKLDINGNSARSVLKELRENGGTSEYIREIARRCHPDGDIIFQSEEDLSALVSYLRESRIGEEKEVLIALNYLGSLPRIGW